MGMKTEKQTVTARDRMLFRRACRQRPAVGSHFRSQASFLTAAPLAGRLL